MPTFELRYDRWCGWLLGLFGMGRRVAKVTVDDAEVAVTTGPWFRSHIPREQVVSIEQVSGRVLGWGVHGWRGRYLVNGSSEGPPKLSSPPVTSADSWGLPW